MMGQKNYNHALDGGDQVLAGCQYDFRNKPYPTKIKFQYYNKKISVWYSAGLTQEAEYELCLTKEYADMPTSKYIGLSAATGGLADDHDVMSLLTFSLREKGSTDKGEKISDKEQERLSEEFKKFSDTMEERKKEFREENPGKFSKESLPDFEDVQERQLRLIFDGQHRLFRSLNEIKSKLDGTGGPGGGGVTPDSLKRIQSEISALSSSINHVYNVANEQKTILKEVQSRVVQMQTGKQPGGGGAAVGSLDASIKSDVTSIKQEVLNLKQSVKKLPTDCPKIVTPEFDNSESDCVSSAVFVLFAVIQIVFVAVVIYFQGRKGDSTKKFY